MRHKYNNGHRHRKYYYSLNNTILLAIMGPFNHFILDTCHCPKADYNEINYPNHTEENPGIFNNVVLQVSAGRKYRTRN